ncbi:hypothetical protein BuS5_00793 [Desulfosarcina sp. BuS5]|uniref:hypothetical protein n=1 Tax=Desulfosarcina sp. BuS5 TaxID=933262 RepID=UPI0012F8E323|nr:hypothetical protein [Desulfosarcina sp. BuS5]WDN87825.1 hypothetical protein BuS5_00793 [Desulfosarcina sp. BuS5]
MDRDLENEKKDLLKKIDISIDPKARKILDSININKPYPIITVVMSTEGTTNASTK